MVETELIVGNKVMLPSKSGRDKHYKVSEIEDGKYHLKGLFDAKDKIITSEELIGYVNE